MALKANFTIDDIKAKVLKDVGKIYAAIEHQLRLVGEKFITNARNTNTYKDRTGNLRASIGYVIYKNGELVEQNFSGGTGGSNAEKVSKAVLKDFPKGYVLIVVAGMEYAAAVESKGFDVITGASLLADDDIKREMQLVKELIKKM